MDSKLLLLPEITEAYIRKGLADAERARRLREAELVTQHLGRRPWRIRFRFGSARQRDLWFSRQQTLQAMSHAIRHDPRIAT